MTTVFLQAFVLEKSALERHRPAFADKSHIGQRLLDADAARRSPDQEDEVQVSIADFADLPIDRAAAQPRRDLRQPRKEGRNAGAVERHVACGCFERQA